jgi:hypothetical protein
MVLRAFLPRSHQLQTSLWIERAHQEGLVFRLGTGVNCQVPTSLAALHVHVYHRIVGMVHNLGLETNQDHWIHPGHVCRTRASYLISSHPRECAQCTVYQLWTEFDNAALVSI